MRRTFRIVVFFFFSDHGACFSLCLCFLVAVPGACVSFFIRLRTFRIDVFGFSSSRSDLFYFFVVSVCTFRIAAFFVFSGSLDVRFELLFSFAFALERAIFVFLPSRIVLFVFRLFSLYAAVLQGTFHIHPFWVGCVWGTGWCFYRPPGLRVVSSPVTGRTFRIAVFSSRLCFFIRPGAFAGGRKFVAVDLCMPPLRVNPSPPRSGLIAVTVATAIVVIHSQPFQLQCAARRDGETRGCLLRRRRQPRG